MISNFPQFCLSPSPLRTRSVCVFSWA